MSGGAAIEHTYLYPFASQLIEASGQSTLQLATSQAGESYPYFFEGRVVQPRTAAQLLTTLARVVSTRYYMPTNMLERIITERDPVVTSGGGMLRFEGFSVCCSTYTRVDFSPEAYTGDLVGVGTTNVDFNPPMRSALARVRDHDMLNVSVGPDEVAVKRGFERVVERKVDLPLRWLKGFVEVQSYQSSMEPRFCVAKAEAIRFLRSLPRTVGPKSAFFVVSAGKGLRLSQIDSAEAVPITGLQRLQLLADLAPLADSLRIFCSPSRQSSEWQLQCGGMFISITITAEISRGFSGEGQVLSDLSASDAASIAKLRSALKWQSLIQISALAQQTQLDEAEVRKGLALLGSRGIVGFDVGNGVYFHREMPFDLDAVESMHPRLKNARRLIEDGKVKILKHAAVTSEFEVASSDVTHRVTMSDQNSRCTCPWYAKYQNSRGPCKHILAAQLAVNALDEDSIE